MSISYFILMSLLLHVGMGIYDAMKLCKADVSTFCLGFAASMGAFLLASGSKGKRFCMPNERVMIHQELWTTGGKVSSGFLPFFLAVDVFIDENVKQQMKDDNILNLEIWGLNSIRWRRLWKLLKPLIEQLKKNVFGSTDLWVAFWLDFLIFLLW